MMFITPILSLLALVILHAEGQLLPVGSECTVDECVRGFIPTYEDGYADFHNLNVCISAPGRTKTSITTQTSRIIAEETRTLTYDGCPGTRRSTTRIRHVVGNSSFTAPDSRASGSHPPSVAAYPTVTSNCTGTTPTPPYDVCNEEQLASVCSCALFLRNVTSSVTQYWSKWITVTVSDLYITEAYPYCATSVPASTYPVTVSSTATPSETPSWPWFPPISTPYPNSTLGSPVFSSSSLAGHNATSTPCAIESSSKSTLISSALLSGGNASVWPPASRPSWNTTSTKSPPRSRSSSKPFWSTEVNATSISRPSTLLSSSTALVPSYPSHHPSSSGLLANASLSSSFVPSTSAAETTAYVNVTSTRIITRSRTTTLPFSNTTFTTASSWNSSSSIFLPTFPLTSSSDLTVPSPASESTTLTTRTSQSSSVTKSSYVTTESSLGPTSSLLYPNSSAVFSSKTKKFSSAESTTSYRLSSSMTTVRPCLGSEASNSMSQTIRFTNSSVRASTMSRVSSSTLGTTLSEFLSSSANGLAYSSSSNASTLANPLYSSASTPSTTSALWISSTPSSVVSTWIIWVTKSYASLQATTPAYSLSTSLSSTTKTYGDGYGHGFDFYPSSTLSSLAPSKPSPSCGSKPLDFGFADKGYQPPYVADYAGCRYNPYDKSRAFKFIWSPTGDLIMNVNGKAAVPRNAADYADAFYTFEEDKGKCGVFDLAFHWENETTYLATYESDGVLGFESSMSASQQFESKEYVTSFWSMDCNGSMYGGLIGDAEFIFRLGPDDRRIRFWSVPAERPPTRTYMKQVAFVMLPDSRDVMEARMIKNMAARMEQANHEEPL